MTVETALSLVTVICDLKRLHHRLEPYLQARLASVVALFHVLLTLCASAASRRRSFQNEHC